MPATLPVQAEPFSTEKTQQIIDQYLREGYAVMPGVLTPDEVARAKELIDRAFADPKFFRTPDRDYGTYILVRMFEYDNFFRDLLVREPIISLMEALLGADCHMIANNVIRNAPGEAISHFHVDDVLWFPLPDEMEQHDPRIRFPSFLVNLQMALTDIESDEFGPTQVVPGSNYSGRQPNDKTNPTWKGRGPLSILAKAGDIYLQHPQVWHRGAPNASNRTRYILQQHYSMRFISQRFFPFVNYQFPPQVLEGADARLRRILGFHGKGAYG